jgi:hypothetical protein
MKKILLFIMLLAPVMTFAQKDAQGGLNKGNSSESSSEIYLTMSLTEYQGQINVKLDFGKVVTQIVADKMLLLDIEELRKMRFDNVIEAMNTLASYGWELEETYDIETRTGALTFLVFSKEVKRLKRLSSDKKSSPSMQSKGGKKPARK